MLQKEERALTEEEKLRMNITSFILGKAHGGIAHILNMPDAVLRERLQQLFDELNEDIAKAFYSNPVLSSAT